jgi:hypothetical protein
MDKNRIAGSIKEIEGAAKVAVGKVIGDAKLQSDGKTDKGRWQDSERRWRPQRCGSRRGDEAVKAAPATTNMICPEARI